MVSRSVFLLLAGLILSSCERSATRLTEEQIDLLASDAHVIVGDIPLVLPFVALKSYVSEGASFSLNRPKDHQEAKSRLEAFRQLATASQTAPTVPRLAVAINTYGWNDLGQDTSRICSRLSIGPTENSLAFAFLGQDPQIIARRVDAASVGAHSRNVGGDFTRPRARVSRHRGRPFRGGGQAWSTLAWEAGLAGLVKWFRDCTAPLQAFT